MEPKDIGDVKIEGMGKTKSPSRLRLGSINVGMKWRCGNTQVDLALENTNPLTYRNGDMKKYNVYRKKSEL